MFFNHFKRQYKDLCTLYSEIISPMLLKFLIVYYSIGFNVFNIRILAANYQKWGWGFAN